MVFQKKELKLGISVQKGHGNDRITCITEEGQDIFLVPTTEVQKQVASSDKLYLGNIIAKEIWLLKDKRGV